MPNTLAHVGFQGPITRSLLRGSDLRWIYIGCVIPDFPWIMQRVVRVAVPGVDPYDLRLYGIVQASLLFCLILGLALALLTDRSLRTFLILSINAFLHLLLDASQIKWATGVHFLAPLSWELTSFGFFWPESPITYLLTLLGLGFMLFTWKQALRAPLGLSPRSSGRIVAAVALAAVYIVLPFSLIGGPEQSDNHFVKTLRDYESRPGRYLEIDRCRYMMENDGGILRTFAGESLKADGIDLDRSALVSIRGRFLGVDRVHVEAYHVHTWFRNAASYVGLSLIALLWLSSLIRKFMN